MQRARDGESVSSRACPLSSGTANPRPLAGAPIILCQPWRLATSFFGTSAGGGFQECEGRLAAAACVNQCCSVAIVVPLAARAPQRVRQSKPITLVDTGCGPFPKHA